ncbi:nuclear transport factor 2 family protein [Candidatus Thiosymbion oneisti]|uniref:nuclear transport factor 2 family protein n=1 Tax=Candidatus Thiosymbion oneisti TaxID=589554 RepID=UPI00105CDA4C|nr:nuclear transport factor 2 family protein [Candidatus Thiosymbion oneisti]
MNEITITAPPEALTREEVERFARDWYRKLDIHAPPEELVAMVATEGLAFDLPEGALHGVAAFRDWYEGVVRIFFDEVHVLDRVEVAWEGPQALVKVRVNWQARRWQAPAPHSEWIGFDVDQDWVMERSPATGQPVILRYVVNALRPMPGSPRL